MLGLLLATQLVGMAPAAQIAPGTYTYTATLAGATVGTSTLNVKSVGVTTEIDEKVTGAVGGQNATENVTLVLGADLAPISYLQNAINDGSPVKDSAKVGNATASVTNVHGQNSSFDLPTSAKHFVVVDIDDFAGYLPLPAQMRAWNDAAVLAVVPSIGQSITLTPDASKSGTRPSGVPTTDVALAFGGQAPFTIWYDPATNVPDEIDVTAQGISVIRQR